MVTYEYDACGMAVNASCAKCDSPLVDSSLILDYETVVQISKCSECEGKIKSPQCCGTDMVANWQSVLLGFIETLACLEGQASLRHITTRAA